MDPELEAMLSQMDPEMLKQLLGMGTLDERGQLLQQQMAQAEALRQPQGGNYSSVGGAIGGGIGDMLRGIGGGLASADIGQKQQALLGQKDTGRNAYVEAMRRKPAPAPAPAPAPTSIRDIIEAGRLTAADEEQLRGLFGAPKTAPIPGSAGMGDFVGAGARPYGLG